MKTGKISERLMVGGQPTEDDLRSLKAQGYEAVINLRRDGEAQPPLDPAGEGKAAAAAGLKYFHIPVNSSDPQREQVEAVRTAISEVNGPVYVHCQGGGRACAMALLGTAPDSGYGSKEMMAQAEKAGFPVSNPAVVAFVCTILDRKA